VIPNPLAPSVRGLAAGLAVVVVAAACATPPASHSPAPSVIATGSPSTSAPPPTATVTGSPLATPSSVPPLAMAELPVQADHEAIARVRLSTTDDGDVFATIPGRSGVVVIRLGADGRLAAGWPVVLPDVVACSGAMAVADGTIRVVCSRGLDVGHRAWAMDAAGLVLPGWPADVPGGLRLHDQRVIGDVLLVVAGELAQQQDAAGMPFFGASVTAIDAAGRVHPGPRERASFGIRWRLGPDGVAYGVEDEDPGSIPPTSSRIRATGLEGPRIGWPVLTDLAAGAPSFGADGRIAVTAADLEGDESRVFAFLPDGRRIVRSQPLPLRTGEIHSEGGVIPAPPLITDDGTMVVVADLDERARAAALEPDGDAVQGWPWPFEAGSGLVHPGYCPPVFELGCAFDAVIPSIGPGGVLYLPLADGTLTALDADGRVQAGWPVALRREGSRFWAVVTGRDGVTYALAVEPEGGAGRYSASILAIAPDGTVLSVTTIAEP
jgi:hypothetical protein